MLSCRRICLRHLLLASLQFLELADLCRLGGGAAAVGACHLDLPKEAQGLPRAMLLVGDLTSVFGKHQCLDDIPEAHVLHRFGQCSPKWHARIFLRLESKTAARGFGMIMLMLFLCCFKESFMPVPLTVSKVKQQSDFLSLGIETVNCRAITSRNCAQVVISLAS